MDKVTPTQPQTSCLKTEVEAKRFMYLSKSKFSCPYNGARSTETFVHVKRGRNICTTGVQQNITNAHYMHPK